jgi:cytoskeletal protein CcmA (bactofilin family)
MFLLVASHVKGNYSNNSQSEKDRSYIDAVVHPVNDPGYVPGYLGNPVYSGETPGIDGKRQAPIDAVVHPVNDPGYVPAYVGNPAYSGETPGIDGKRQAPIDAVVHPANDPGHVPGYVGNPAYSAENPRIIPNFTPGVDPFYDPSSGKHSITEQNKKDPIRSGTSTTLSTDHTTASLASVEKYTVSPQGKEHVTPKGSLSSAQPVEVDGSLVIDGDVTTSTLNIKQDGTLEHHGALQGNLYNEGNVATDTTQTATVDGNVTQSSTGTLQVKVPTGSNHSALQVNGNVDLNGQIEITSEQEVTPGSTQKIMGLYQITSLNFSQPIV